LFCEARQSAFDAAKKRAPTASVAQTAVGVIREPGTDGAIINITFISASWRPITRRLVGGEAAQFERD
jgi:hypothetical protein